MPVESCASRGGCSYVVIGRLVLGGHLDAVGEETEDGADPEQDGEAPKQLLAELDPLGRGGGRGQGVGAVAGQDLQRSLLGQTLWDTHTCAVTTVPLATPPSQREASPW